MKNKIKILLVVIQILIIIVINNVSYASTVTAQDFINSFEKLIKENIKIDTKYQNSTATNTIGFDDINFEFEESKIKIKDTEEEYYMNYIVDDEKCKFSTVINLNNIDEDIDEDNVEEYTVKLLASVLLYSDWFDVCYLAVADAQGTDLSLAYTYYYQKNNEEQENEEQENEELQNFKSISNDVYSEYIELDEDIYKITLEINLENLSKLDWKDIDTTSYYAEVTLGVDNSTNEEENTIDNSNITNEVENNTNITKIPQTGKTIELVDILYIIATISIISLVGLYIYNKNRG